MQQIEMFPDLASTLTPEEEQELQYMMSTSRINADKRADDMQAGGSHYKDMGVQPWTVMEALLTREEFIGYLKGNLIKYGMRQGKKDSPDAEKWHHYNMKLKEIQNGNA
jgi:hypothetical protein